MFKPCSPKESAYEIYYYVIDQVIKYWPSVIQILGQQYWDEASDQYS